MSIGQDRRQAMQATADENRVSFKFIAITFITICAIGGGAGFAYKTYSSRSKAVRSVVQQPAEKGFAYYLAEWFRAGRNRKPGESAEDYVYANCVGAHAITSNIRGVGRDRMMSVDNMIHGGRQRVKLDAQTACRNLSKGFIWKKREPPPPPSRFGAPRFGF